MYGWMRGMCTGCRKFGARCVRSWCGLELDGYRKNWSRFGTYRVWTQPRLERWNKQIARFYFSISIFEAMIGLCRTMYLRKEEKTRFKWVSNEKHGSAAGKEVEMFNNYDRKRSSPRRGLRRWDTNSGILISPLLDDTPAVKNNFAEASHFVSGILPESQIRWVSGSVHEKNPLHRSSKKISMFPESPGLSGLTLIGLK